uniref:THD domain-containing protein n=1 Tax=Cyprinus carpio TaxID=7962 RepID=A0A8C1QSD3_CYPCA
MVGKLSHIKRTEVLLFTMCSVFIRLVFSTDSNEILPAKPPNAESKPAAFLQSMEQLLHTRIASPPFSGNGVLHWRADSFPVFMRGLEYKDNSLYVQQDGYYYIFSKISHMENCNFFKHQVMQCTERYNFKAIELMQSSSLKAHECFYSRFICVTNLSQSRGNSYLGGIFHLLKGDSVFVKVSNSSQVHGEAYENFFGAFMV